MAGKKLSGLPFPSKLNEAATKEYVDRVGVDTRKHADRVANSAREYVDRSTELLGRRFLNLPFAFLKDNGNFVAHTPISMASQSLRDLTEPKETSDAVTKKYVDDLIADNVGNINGGRGSPFFKENGYYQTTHAFNMALKLLNLSTRSEPFEAATKEYVDKVGNDVGKYVDEKNAHIKRQVDDFTKLLDYVKKTIDERPHIVMVHASYSGKLRKDEYQFTFGGTEDPD